MTTKSFRKIKKGATNTMRKKNAVQMVNQAKEEKNGSSKLWFTRKS